MAPLDAIEGRRHLLAGLVEHTGSDAIRPDPFVEMRLDDERVGLGLVAVGGATGTLVRWLITEQIVDPPAATTAMLVLNVAGSVILGLLLGRRSVGQRIRWTVGTGFCGGLTSFSSFAVTVAGDLDAGAWTDAVTSLIGTISLAVAGAAIGMTVTAGDPR